VCLDLRQAKVDAARRLTVALVAAASAALADSQADGSNIDNSLVIRRCLRRVEHVKKETLTPRGSWTVEGNRGADAGDDVGDDLSVDIGR